MYLSECLDPIPVAVIQSSEQNLAPSPLWWGCQGGRSLSNRSHPIHNQEHRAMNPSSSSPFYIQFRMPAQGVLSPTVKDEPFHTHQCNQDNPSEAWPEARLPGESGCQPLTELE